ncbi:MAG: hypothetical protein ACR2HG_01110 [Pyrinomonadaceae bacterium]
MNTILSEENNFQEDAAVRTSIARLPKSGKVTGILSLGFAAAAIISAFLPFLSAFLFWNFLLLSVALVVFGFLETNSGKTWIDNITWVVSLSLLILLFIMAFGSFKNPQSLYFYAGFSIIVPILMTIAALGSKKAAIWKSLSPLLVPALFVVSTVFLSPKTVLSLLLLLLSWSALGALNYLDSTEG